MTRFSVIFCDDIRQEDTGKHLLIGVYSGDLIPGAVPSTFNLCMMVRIEGVTGEHHFRMRVFGPGGEVAVEIEDDLDIDANAGAFPLVVVRIPIEVETGSGEITADFTLDDGEPEQIAALKIRVPAAPVSPH